MFTHYDLFPDDQHAADCIQSISSNHAKSTTGKFDDVLYPIVATSHSLDHVADSLKRHMLDRNHLTLHLAIKPDGVPHLGHMVSIACTFALANLFRAHYLVNVEVVFDILDNAPSTYGRRMDTGVLIERSIRDTPHGGLGSEASYSLASFILLWDRLSVMANVPCSTRSYQETITHRTARKNMLRMLNGYDTFAPLLDPSHERINIRIACPKCRYMPAYPSKINVLHVSAEHAQLSMNCQEHGTYECDLYEHNTSLIDVDPTIYEVLRGSQLLEQAQAHKLLPILVNMNDDANTYALGVYKDALHALGYKKTNIPPRYFTPVITDWSGAKMSRTHFTDTSYKRIPPEFLDFHLFERIYGEHGLQRLWELATEWVEQPSHFFRTYSLQYFTHIFL